MHGFMFGSVGQAPSLQLPTIFGSYHSISNQSMPWASAAAYSRRRDCHCCTHPPTYPFSLRLFQ